MDSGLCIRVCACVCVCAVADFVDVAALQATHAITIILLCYAARTFSTVSSSSSITRRCCLYTCKLVSCVFVHVCTYVRDVRVCACMRARILRMLCNENSVKHTLLEMVLLLLLPI